jgi:hypothetical protein
VYCSGLAGHGHDYQDDDGPGRCPKTFSIVGVMSWQNPDWGQMPDNQNGTFPFNRDSTAFALDYYAAYLRGCLEGWVSWLDNTGAGDYRPGDLLGCVGAWYAGAWRTDAANTYIGKVESALADKPWLKPSFPEARPRCSLIHGCPRGS